MKPSKSFGIFWGRKIMMRDRDATPGVFTDNVMHRDAKTKFLGTP
jgi:hypothetical protein